MNNITLAADLCSNLTISPGWNQLTVYDTIKDLNAQYMTKMLWFSLFLLSYTIYNSFIRNLTYKGSYLDKENFKQNWKHIIGFYFDYAAFVGASFLFILSTVYAGWWNW